MVEIDSAFGNFATPRKLSRKRDKYEKTRK